MGRELLSEFPAVKATFEEAEDAARIPIRKLCIDGPEDQLRLTANTQPCILTVSTAVWRVLKNETGITPECFAGHSLGEYSAVVAAGRLDLSTAAMLVRRRGEAMQEAVPAGTGAMAAVMNISAEDLRDRCKALCKLNKIVEVVNYNSPQQLVVAGHKAAVDDLCAQLETAGVRFVQLPVSAPFHSSLMEPARKVMAPLISDAAFVSNNSKVIANLTGKVESDYGPRFLIEQINNAVLWTQSLDIAVEEGCDTYVEIGPSKVLFGLARRCLPKTAKILHTDEIVKAIADIKALS
jgi:[acyl-carrier-protein] S-malonyltransferase